MRRIILINLIEWKTSLDRKPLLLRGARQVGKTYTVRTFGQEHFEHMIEVNFEKHYRALLSIFRKDLDPKRIIKELSLLLNKQIIAGKTLLFFDEIQMVPEAIQALRYFYEEIPGLHVIGAGSLIDFALDKMGIPVGRVSFLYLYPLSFIEFLGAHQEFLLIEEILEHTPAYPLSEVIHQKLLDYLLAYIAVGGMPKSVSTWLVSQDVGRCADIQYELIAAYQQDFLKYGKSHQIKYLELFLNKIPYQLGKIFKYAHISQEYRKRELEPCLDLLEKAGIVHRVYNTRANGLPLRAEVSPDRFKLIFLDIALCQSLLGFPAQNWMLNGMESLKNYGAIVEAFVGQELLAYSKPQHHDSLYYWENTKPSSIAEIDYLITQAQNIIPIEVKSATSGQLKSMHLFLKLHQKSQMGIRFSKHNYSIVDKIVSYPLYAIAKVCRLKTEIIEILKAN